MALWATHNKNEKSTKNDHLGWTGLKQCKPQTKIHKIWWETKQHMYIPEVISIKEHKLKQSEVVYSPNSCAIQDCTCAKVLILFSYHPSVCDRGLPNDGGEEAACLLYTGWPPLALHGLLGIVCQTRTHHQQSAQTQNETWMGDECQIHSDNTFSAYCKCSI